MNMRVTIILPTPYLYFMDKKIGTHSCYEITKITVWFNLNQTSRNLAHGLIHFKIVHRAYATPYRRYQMKLISSYACNICKLSSWDIHSHVLGMFKCMDSYSRFTI